MKIPITKFKNQDFINMSNMNSELMKQFNETMKLVAARYEDQVRLFPGFVHIPDEVALTFDDIYRALPQLKYDLSGRAVALIDELNNMFSMMSEDKAFWTLEKMKNDVTWSVTRRLAKDILHETGQDIELPKMNFVTWPGYVKG